MSVGVICQRCGGELADAYRACPTCLAEGVPVNGITTYPLEELASRAEPTTALHDGSLLPVGGLQRAPVTPLEAAHRLGELAGVPLFIKNETVGATWSHKDRLARVAAAHARARGAPVVILSSSGNHGAAVAAACARSELPCVVLTVTSITGPLRRLIAGLGGRLVALERSEWRWTLVADAVDDLGWYPASNFARPPIGSNPYVIDGYKPIAWELWEQLGTLPDWIVIPVGYGDLLSGVLKGCEELVALGLAERVPRLLAAETSDSIACALADDLDVPPERPVRAPEALSILAPRATYQTVRAVRRSGGRAWTVNSRAAFDARDALARLEGAHHELASAAAVAAAIDAGPRVFGDNAVVVVLATSTGLKDESERGEPPLAVVPPELDALTVLFPDLVARDGAARPAAVAPAAAATPPL